MKKMIVDYYFDMTERLIEDCVEDSEFERDFKEGHEQRKQMLLDQCDNLGKEDVMSLILIHVNETAKYLMLIIQMEKCMAKDDFKGIQKLLSLMNDME